MKSYLGLFGSDTGKYDKVLDQEEGLDSSYAESKGMIADQSPAFAKVTRSTLLYISTLVFAALAGFLFAQNIQLRTGASFQNGYGNELGKASS